MSIKIKYYNSISMSKEVNINLGLEPKEKGSSCFDGACPPNPSHAAESLEPVIPMILGLILTLMKMDQFNRPLANTAMQMIEGLAPQIEKNAGQVGDIINSLSEATHNVAAKMTKHEYDFTKEDRVHLIKMLIDEDNYLDSYESVITFLKDKSPGFIKALYKSMMANQKGDGEHVKHSNSSQGKKMIATVSDNRPKAVTDRYTNLHDNLLDGHINKVKKALALSTVGLEGKGLIKSPKAAKTIKKYTDTNTDNPSPELSENVAILNEKAKIDDVTASKSLKQSLKGDEKGAKKTIEEDKNLEDITPSKESISSAEKEIKDNSKKTTKETESGSEKETESGSEKETESGSEQDNQ